MNQIDIVPTLSGLMGFPIPLINEGIFIPDMLSAFDDDMKAVEFLLENAKQIYRALKILTKSLNKAIVLDDDKYSTRHYDDLGRTDDLWEAVLLAEKAWVDLPSSEAREHLKISIYEPSRVHSMSMICSVFTDTTILTEVWSCDIVEEGD